jgi:hypothetical protein
VGLRAMRVLLSDFRLVPHLAVCANCSRTFTIPSGQTGSEEKALALLQTQFDRHECALEHGRGALGSAEPHDTNLSD